MANQAKNSKQATAETSAGDPLFTLHHAQAEAELERQNPAAMTAASMATEDRAVLGADATPTPEVPGPVDSQGNRPGQQPEPPISGASAGHH